MIQLLVIASFYLLSLTDYLSAYLSCWLCISREFCPRSLSSRNSLGVLPHQQAAELSQLAIPLLFALFHSDLSRGTRKLEAGCIRQLQSSSYFKRPSKREKFSILGFTPQIPPQPATLNSLWVSHMWQDQVHKPLSSASQDVSKQKVGLEAEKSGREPRHPKWQLNPHCHNVCPSGSSFKTVFYRYAHRYILKKDFKKINGILLFMVKKWISHLF